MRIPLALLLSISMLTGCNDDPSAPIKHADKDTSQPQTFFPVTEYIKGQLAEIDSLPVTPLRIITQNGKQDSAWMKKNDIRPFAEPFLHPVIDTSNFKELFKERSFLDQTINAFTFSYDPIDKLPDTLQLKRWDVYIDPKKNTITRIFIVKEIKTPEGLETLQLTWKAGAWCKITTILEKERQQPIVKEEQMKWELGEE